MLTNLGRQKEAFDAWTAIFSLVHCPCLLERFRDQRFQDFAGFIKLAMGGQEPSEGKFGFAL